jgi:pyrroloquinoline quinone (PQQ) biosynthesis protein C
MDIDWLKKNLDAEMEKSLATKTTRMFLTPGMVDKRYYALYMTETYHYTYHNARNQALVAARRENLNINYMKFCLKHALEEAGHEMMALHDLKLMLGKQQLELPEPLNCTEALIDYLYEVASKENPVARLGYSFWAERIYSYIAPMLSMLQQGMGVDRKAMTFFVEHSDIDAEHAKDVDQAIKQFAKTEDDWQSINRVMLHTLELTRKMTDEIMDEFLKLKEGKSSRYAHYFS